MGLSPFILHLKNKQTETTHKTPRQNPAIGFSIQFQQVDTCHLNVHVLVSQLVREHIEEIGRKKKNKKRKEEEEEEEIISRI